MTLLLEIMNKYVSNKFMKACVKIVNISNVARKNTWLWSLVTPLGRLKVNWYFTLRESLTAVDNSNVMTMSCLMLATNVRHESIVVIGICIIKIF